MTEKERLMYSVMSRISETDTPIVFKGAMVAKLILAAGGYSGLERQTKDIDANWVGKPPSMDALVKAINDSLGDLRERFYADSFREYGQKTSAGVSIRDKETGEEALQMDIRMSPSTAASYTITAKSA